MFFAGDMSCKYYETTGSPMIEQQDAFGGPFFKIVILRVWWCGIHIQILSIIVTDGERTYFHVE